MHYVLSCTSYDLLNWLCCCCPLSSDTNTIMAHSFGSLRVESDKGKKSKKTSSITIRLFEMPKELDLSFWEHSCPAYCKKYRLLCYLVIKLVTFCVSCRVTSWNQGIMICYKIRLYSDRSEFNSELWHFSFRYISFLILIHQLSHSDSSAFSFWK